MILSNSSCNAQTINLNKDACFQLVINTLFSRWKISGRTIYIPSI